MAKRSLCGAPTTRRLLTAVDGYAVMFRTGGPGSVLANFVITGCSDAGILCDSASPTLKNLTIVGNGTGIVAYEGSDPNITNCISGITSDADLYGGEGGRPKPRFSNIQDNRPDKAAGNLQTDPKFADRTRERLPSEVPVGPLGSAESGVGDRQ